jgi:hypothetical protein
MMSHSLKKLMLSCAAVSLLSLGYASNTLTEEEQLTLAMKLSSGNPVGEQEALWQLYQSQYKKDFVEKNFLKATSYSLSIQEKTELKNFIKNIDKFPKGLVVSQETAVTWTPFLLDFTKNEDRYLAVASKLTKGKVLDVNEAASLLIDHMDKDQERFVQALTDLQSYINGLGSGEIKEFYRINKIAVLFSTVVSLADACDQVLEDGGHAFKKDLIQRLDGIILMSTEEAIIRRASYGCELIRSLGAYLDVLLSLPEETKGASVPVTLEGKKEVFINDDLMDKSFAAAVALQAQFKEEAKKAEGDLKLAQQLQTLGLNPAPVKMTQPNPIYLGFDNDRQMLLEFQKELQQKDTLETDRALAKLLQEEDNQGFEFQNFANLPKWTPLTQDEQKILKDIRTRVGGAAQDMDVHAFNKAYIAPIATNLMALSDKILKDHKNLMTEADALKAIEDQQQFFTKNIPDFATGWAQHKGYLAQNFTSGETGLNLKRLFVNTVSLAVLCDKLHPNAPLHHLGLVARYIAQNVTGQGGCAEGHVGREAFVLSQLSTVLYP